MNQLIVWEYGIKSSMLQIVIFFLKYFDLAQILKEFCKCQTGVAIYSDFTFLKKKDRFY